MSQFLYRRFQEQGWLQPDQTARLTAPLGIVIRVEQEDDDTKYVVSPEGVSDDLQVISSQLNLAVVFTMSSDITSLIFKRIGKDDSEITLSPNNVTVPVVHSLSELAKDSTSVRRRDFCCFVRKEKVVLVWSNSADEVMLHGADVETKLMSSVNSPHSFLHVYKTINNLDLGNYDPFNPTDPAPPTPAHNWYRA
jgi:hypothetical protein